MKEFIFLFSLVFLIGCEKQDQALTFKDPSLFLVSDIKEARGYISITNPNEKDDCMLEALSPDCGRIDFQAFSKDEGAISIRQIRLPSKQTVVFSEKTYYLVFYNLNASVLEKKYIDVTLLFKNSEKKDIRFILTSIKT